VDSPQALGERVDGAGEVCRELGDAFVGGVEGVVDGACFTRDGLDLPAHPQRVLSRETSGVTGYGIDAGPKLLGDAHRLGARGVEGTARPLTGLGEALFEVARPDVAAGAGAGNLLVQSLQGGGRSLSAPSARSNARRARESPRSIGRSRAALRAACVGWRWGRVLWRSSSEVLCPAVGLRWGVGAPYDTPG
jgi:hypothetical protein